MDRTDKGFGIFAICAFAGLLIIAAVNLIQAWGSAHPVKVIAYSHFLDDVEQSQVRSVTMGGARIIGTLVDGTVFRSYAADDPDLFRTLRRKGVTITAVAAPAEGPSWLGVLSSVLPLVILVGVALFFIRRMPATSSGTGLGRSKAKLLARAQSRVTFADVAGVDEAKESLQEIVDFLRDSASFQQLGGRIPRGVLLVGPPGAGKTLLARAIAGEAGVPFFTIAGSDFVEMFVGVGASRVRDMFGQAAKSAPCIIFVDEIDAVGRRRGAGVGGSSEEREQTLNQLLVEMDGFESNEGVILIAATNRPDVLDPALLRPGRFDREIVVGNPDVIGREHILQVHVRKLPLASDVDLKVVARGTPGFSGADLMNLVNEAALLAARRRRQSVGMGEFEDAKDTVTMGAERRTHVMTDNEKRLTAYREGGRAIVALHAPSADPVHKVTIVTRGRATGMVKQLAQDDQVLMTLEQMTSRLAIMMGGRAAEEMIFGRDNVTSGAAADIEQATKLARLMVTRWGLSEALGTITYGDSQDDVFLGQSSTRPYELSEQTAHLIIAEVRRLVDAALAQARRILTEHRQELEVLAAGLLKRETLSGAEIRDMLTGRFAAGGDGEVSTPLLAKTGAQSMPEAHSLP